MERKREREREMAHRDGRQAQRDQRSLLNEFHRELDTITKTKTKM